MNINENIWIERLEIMGDAMDAVREEESRIEVQEAMADESTMTEEEIEAWADMWLAKENA